MCRRFHLVRDQSDGVNQPGIVAEGVVFASGKVALCWTQQPHSIQTFDTVADVLTIQKQNGVTRVTWVDRSTERPVVHSEGRPRLQEAREALAAVLGPDHVLVSAESSRSVRVDYTRGISGPHEIYTPTSTKG